MTLHQRIFKESLRKMSKYKTVPYYSPAFPIMCFVHIAKKMGLIKYFINDLGKLAFNDRKRRKIFAGYEPTSHDVFATVYSKSGTNWVLQAIQQISHRGEAEFEHIHDVVAWPEAPFMRPIELNDSTPRIKSPTSYRGIKTNMKTDFVPYNVQAKYICLIRDPKEVFVSNFHFIPSQFGFAGYVTIEEWLDFFLSPKFSIGSWAEHADSYWALRDRPNVMVTFFHEMKKDHRGVLKKIVDLMEVSLTDSQFEKVIEKCSFQYMKQHDAQFAPPKFPLIKDFTVMIRSGKSGGSGELLTKAQQTRIDQYFMDELKRMSSDFPYRDIFKVLE